MSALNLIKNSWDAVAADKCSQFDHKVFERFCRPDEKWGETPCAFVELHGGTAMATTEQDIISFAKEVRGSVSQVQVCNCVHTCLLERICGGNSLLFSSSLCAYVRGLVGGW